MGIPADQKHSGLGKALLGADNMNNSLARIVEREVDYAEPLGILRQELDHAPLFGVFDRGNVVAHRRDAVIGRGKHLIGPADNQSAVTQKFECVAGAIMCKVTGDVQ